MFTLNDFWNILDFLKNGTSSTLNSIVRALAENQKAKATLLFENTLDQIPFLTDDYKRLRKFLIDWYAAHRTLISIQQHASDFFSLPETQLNEILKSFGFNFSLGQLPQKSRVNLLLDLVNLYKIKGTPSSLRGILSYFGLPNIYIAEYWLRLVNGKLIFRPEIISESDLPFKWPDVDFETITSRDPHWKLSEEDIFKLINNNLISLPSKTSYFSISPIFDITNIYAIISYFMCVIKSCWDLYFKNGIMDDEISIEFLKLKTNSLSLFIGICYALKKHYDRVVDVSNNAKLLFYDSTSVPTLDYILHIASGFNTRPESRKIREEKIVEFNSIFTRPWEETFLYNTDLESLLLTMDSSLKEAIDFWLLSEKGVDLVTILLKSFADWAIKKIPLYDMSILILGTRSFFNILDIINFFKPYKARLVFFTPTYLINDIFRDSIIVEDSFFLPSFNNKFIDFDTADGSPCGTSYSRETYDCGSYYDIGSSYDKFAITEVTRSLDEKLNVHSSDSESYTFLEYITDATANIEFVIHSGGWAEFDSGFYFDSNFGNDIVQIYRG